MRVLLLMILAVFSLSVSAQTITATGNVKDATGDPIIGASIVEKGNTSNGTITNLDGDFSLKVPANATLIVSYIGMKTQEIAIKGKNKIDVTLSDDTKALDEVVVIGYGTAKRKDITGSVATVSSEVLSAVPVASATEALQGKMAGVQITTTEGSPDAEMKIRVRGGGSITGDNTPLFIVDGFPVESISDIPASDIEDMTVLKDASSTAIYGSRGANGVILVTTKSGKEGKLSVSYNTYYSWKKMAKTLETLSATDYVKWQREYALLRGNESKFTSLFGNWQDADLYENAPTNDWQDQVFGRTGNTFNHSLTISGGSDKTKFNMGYAHMNDKAIMLGSSFRRDNLSLKLNHKVNDKVSLDFSMRYANTTVNGAGANESKSEVSSADSRMKNVMIYPMFNFPDLSDSYDPDFQLTNPITSVYDTDRKQNRQTFNMNGSFSWEIFKNFKFKTEFGLDWYYNTDKKYYGPSTYNARTNSSDTEGVHPMAYFADTQRKTFRNTNTVNYNFKDIIKNKDHNLNVLVGEETINKKSSLNDDRLSFFPVSFTASQAWALSSQGTPYSVDKYTNADDNLLSYFGRVNYDFQSKYLISGTFRADGSSKFSKGNRWGYFPSVAAAWRVNEEAFLSNFKALSDLKLRLSYGQTGQQSIGSYYQHLPTYTASYDESRYYFGDQWYTTYRPNGYDANIKWETTETYNIGIDYGFLNNRISGTIDYYWRTTKDLLNKIFVPAGSNFTNMIETNIGNMKSKGLEIGINVIPVKNKDWEWTVSGNFTWNTSEITKLNTIDREDNYVKTGNAGGTGKYLQVHMVGETPNTFYLLQQAYDDNGKPLDGKYIAKDGSVTSSEEDANKYVTGKSSKAPYYCGLSTRLTYKNWDLGINGHGSFGAYVYNYVKASDSLDGLYGGTGVSSNILRSTLETGFTQDRIYTDYFLEKGDFFRIDNITLGHTFDKLWNEKTSLRLSFTVQNVCTLTGYSGLDPEIYSGIDKNIYQRPRMFMLGVNLNF